MLRSAITLKITGYNCAELLSRLQKEGIKLQKVRKLDKKTTLLTVSQKDSKKTFAICQSMWYTYGVETRSGWTESVRNALKRVGVFTGVAACVALAVYCSSVLSEIKIEGNAFVSDNAILSAIEATGAVKGARLSSIDRDEVYSALIGLDGIAEASVQLRGNTLKLTVLERGKQATGEDVGNAIVSDFDGVITSLSCVSGTARVRVGQIVKKGDLLIEGVVYDAQGEARSVSAIGEAYGRVSESKTFERSLTTVTYARTGKKKSSTSVSFLGFKSAIKPSSFVTSDVESGTGTLCFLPIGFTRTTYYETRLVETKRTPDEILQEVEFAARECNPEAVITSRSRQIAEETYEITIITQSERKISKPQ